VSYNEEDESVTMNVSDYIKYLRKLENSSVPDNGDFSFTYRDQDGVPHTIDDFRDTVFYMIDGKLMLLLTGTKPR
jgi:hypothetical protein